MQSNYEKTANQFSEQNYKQYKEILKVLEDEAYEPSFRYLMLNETLTKVYKREKNNGKEITIVDNRDLEKSISGHMVLKKFTLEYIYKGIEEGNVNSFKDLYNDAVSEYQTVISQESEINLEDVNTYNKGKWLRFKGAQSDPDNYLSNASKLSALVQGTPWCTKTLAASQLNEGDFFVFVDNNEKPHIAVKMLGSTIDEVRGIQNGNAQELEEEYRDVALSFLENNKDIENGAQWLEKEEWNQRLIEYGHKMQCHEFGVESVEALLNDLFFREDYNNHSFCKNSNLTKLKNQLYLAKPIFAQYFGMKEEEVCCGDCFSSNMNNVRIVLGNFNGCFDSSKIQTIYGDAYFDHTTSLENLESIYGGNATFHSCVIPEIQGINMKYLILYNSVIDRIKQCELHSISSHNSKIGEIQDINTLKSIYVEDGEIEKIEGVDSLDALETQNATIKNFGTLTNINSFKAIACDFTNLGKIQNVNNLTMSGVNIHTRGNISNVSRMSCSQDFDITKLGKITKLDYLKTGKKFNPSHISEINELQLVGGLDGFDISRLNYLGTIHFESSNPAKDYEEAQNDETIKYSIRVWGG